MMGIFQFPLIKKKFGNKFKNGKKWGFSVDKTPTMPLFLRERKAQWNHRGNCVQQPEQPLYQLTGYIGLAMGWIANLLGDVLHPLYGIRLIGADVSIFKFALLKKEAEVNEYLPGAINISEIWHQEELHKHPKKFTECVNAIQMIVNELEGYMNYYQ